jgi:hypothetical protein
MRAYLESNGQQIPPVLIGELVVYVKNMPQYKDILYDQNGQLRQQEAQAIVQTLLRQPQYRRAIHRLFTERLDPKKRLEHESIVTALEREIKQLEAQIIDPKKIDAEIAQKRLELNQKNVAIIQDPNYGDYSNLLGQLETAQEELKTFQEIYKQAKINNPSQLQQITQDINNKKQEIHNLQRSLSDQRFSNIYQLQQEASSLQASI